MTNLYSCDVLSEEDENVFLRCTHGMTQDSVCVCVCVNAVSLVASPHGKPDCYCSCDRPSSFLSLDSHFRCFPASALLLYFLFFSSVHPPSFVFLLRLVLSDCLLLYYPHSSHSCQPENDWRSHLARQTRATLSLTPSSHWLLPGQWSDWVGLPASCLLSQMVIWGCVL